MDFASPHPRKNKNNAIKFHITNKLKNKKNILVTGRGGL
jgi:hypothetical protein